MSGEKNLEQKCHDLIAAGKKASGGEWQAPALFKCLRHNRFLDDKGAHQDADFIALARNTAPKIAQACLYAQATIAAQAKRIAELEASCAK